MKRGPGIVLSLDYMDVQSALKIANLADKNGLTQISVPETWGHDAITFVSALCMKTENIDLSTGIVNIFSRSPTVIGMTAASLQKLSNDRFILGIGLSGPGVVQDWHGMSYTKPITRTKEFMKIIRTTLARERVTFENTLLGNFKRFRLSVEKQPTEIEIHIASLGPKNVELTAKQADGWIPINSPISSMSEQIKSVEEIRRKEGLSMDNFHVTPFIIGCLGDSHEKIELIRRHLFYYFGTMGTKKDNFYNNMLKRAGFEDEAAEIQSLFLEGKVEQAIAAVSDELVAACSIYGSKDDVIDKLEKLQDKGITRPLLGLPFKSKFEYFEELLNAVQV